jgi:hypothetical protein
VSMNGTLAGLPTDVRIVLAQAKANGFDVRRTGGGHIQVCDAEGTPLATTGSTPSDHRAVRNFRAQLRRAGVLEAPAKSAKSGQQEREQKSSVIVSTLSGRAEPGCSYSLVELVELLNGEWNGRSVSMSLRYHCKRDDSEWSTEDGKHFVYKARQRSRAEVAAEALNSLAERRERSRRMVDVARDLAEGVLEPDADAAQNDAVTINAAPDERQAFESFPSRQELGLVQQPTNGHGTPGPAVEAVTGSQLFELLGHDLGGNMLLRADDGVVYVARRLGV